MSKRKKPKPNLSLRRFNINSLLQSYSMTCFNCGKKCERERGLKRHQQPHMISHRLQAKKYEVDHIKPNCTILDGLENISDGEMTMETLKKYSQWFICHECLRLLRLAVNKKFELDHHLKCLYDSVDKINKEERLNYFKKNYGKDRNGFCWACLRNFVPADYRKKYSLRFSMKRNVVEEMTVQEAIQILLEDQADPATLTGIYGKKNYMCRGCVNLLRNVIKSQCTFDTLHTKFLASTKPGSVYARVQAGEEVTDLPSVYNDCVESVDSDSYTEVTDEEDDGSESDHTNVLTISDDANETNEQLDGRKRLRKRRLDESEQIEPSSSEDIDKNSCSVTVKKESDDKSETKMQIKLNLMGNKIKDAAVVEITNKKPKLISEKNDKPSDVNTSDKTMSDQWKLYYYTGFAGRAEFIRLMFEEADVLYVQSTEGFAELRKLIIDGEMEGYPHFAPPVVTKGDLQISQTPVICKYLGQQYGLYPDTVEDQLHAEQINQCCHDFIAEDFCMEISCVMLI
ncbi:hypothetical protein ACF0H5_018073 [Mactra antiquata]